MLFKLRAGARVSVLVSNAEVAAALPHPDAHAWFEAERAAAHGQGCELRGWFTLREAAALVGTGFHDAFFRFRNFDQDRAYEGDREPSMRRAGAWELVSAEGISRYLTRYKSKLNADDYADEIAAECTRRTVEAALIEQCAHVWVFNDGTRLGLGGHVSGGSRFADELRETLRNERIGVSWGGHPGGGREIDRNDLAWFDLWARQNSKTWAYWRDQTIKLIERPENIPPLPAQPRERDAHPGDKH